eukprot:TRINITY_DN6417_c0_g1_i1.p1 TRINITY_DN6417_c0_g1~~TRINITY_DN6417_c0_g1_i1.p1  ORF type:complete len:245 (+),score=23.25 TRINITY_DN6417_c0_g1_i1:106-735(+)
MLKKIRQDFDASVSMEDILVNLSFLKKFKFFYLAFGFISIVIFIAQVVIEVTSTHMVSFVVMSRIYDGYFCLIWLGFACGFMWYGIKLMRIMPPTIANKIREMTILISVFSVSALASNLISISTVEIEDYRVNGVWEYYAYHFCDMVGLYSAIFMYIPIWQWHKWFNSTMIRSLLSTSRTSNQSSHHSSASIETTVTGNSDKNPQETSV